MILGNLALFETFIRMLKRAANDRRGGTAITFAILAPVLAVLAVAVIDLYRQSNMRQQLQASLDAAALIVARSSPKTDSDAQSVGAKAFAEEAGKYKLKVSGTSFKLGPDNTVIASTTGSIDAFILGAVGRPTLDTRVEALVKRSQGTPIELVLVLDTTASMGGKPLADLKDAATKLVEKVHANATPGNLKIGVVPFGEHVNVGMSRRYEPWMKVAPDRTDPITTAGKWVTPTKRVCTGERWVPCAPVDGRSPGTMCKEDTGCTNQRTGPDYWQEPKTTNKLYTWYGCAGSIHPPGHLKDNNPHRQYPGPLDLKCSSEITTLTDNKQTVVTAIGKLTATGYTYIPAGLTWGYNMLSKAAPLTDAADYDPSGANLQPRKVMVLMTDGANTRMMQAIPKANGDFGQWHTKAIQNAAQLKKVNDDMLAICQNAKDEKIEIFTVAFLLDDVATKDLIQSCATDSDHYYDASDAAKLQAAFSDIAQSLRNLYIAK
jgi:Flp pilus assembly protein TadG